MFFNCKSTDLQFLSAVDDILLPCIIGRVDFLSLLNALQGQLIVKWNPLVSCKSVLISISLWVMNGFASTSGSEVFKCLHFSSVCPVWACCRIFVIPLFVIVLWLFSCDFRSNCRTNNHSKSVQAVFEGVIQVEFFCSIPKEDHGVRIVRQILHFHKNFQVFLCRGSY